jgi:glycosyltransferase involved in cell wall biosynthesis
VPGLTVAMPVHNEAGRYLREVLESAARYADRIVVVDDCSTDESAEVALAFGAEVHRTREPLFGNEVRLRETLWEAATATRPEWILALDADELFEAGFEAVVPGLLRQAAYGWFAFRLYDLWDDRRHYRDDALWTAHTRWWPMLVRYREGFPYRFRQQAHHCGRLPENALQGQGAACTAKLLHLGWLRPDDRRRKYERYMRLDPGGRWGSLAQYESILDPQPRLSALEVSPCPAS